jgi:hypothetical protein
MVCRHDGDLLVCTGNQLIKVNLIRGAIRPSLRVGHSSLEVCTPESLLVHGWRLKATPADVQSNPRVMRRMKSAPYRAWVRLSDFRIGSSRHHHGSAPLTSVRDICLWIYHLHPCKNRRRRHGLTVTKQTRCLGVRHRRHYVCIVAFATIQTRARILLSMALVVKDSPPCQAWAFEGGALELHGALGIKFHYIETCDTLRFLCLHKFSSRSKTESLGYLVSLE